VRRVELGSASALDQKLAAWRGQIQTGRAAAEAGRELARLVWEPLRPHVTDVSTVLVAPDGHLAFLPWGALPDREPGSVVLQRRAFAVVGSGRQVAELARNNPARTGRGLLAVGGVDDGKEVAGARTVVASLWDIGDEATQRLMAEFYKNLWEKRQPKLEALRQAQLTLLREYKPYGGPARTGVVTSGPRRVEAPGEEAGRSRARVAAAVLLCGVRPLGRLALTRPQGMPGKSTANLPQKPSRRQLNLRPTCGLHRSPGLSIVGNPAISAQKGA